MRRLNLVWLVISLLVAAMLTGNALAAKKVVVVSGTSKENAPKVGYHLVYNGIDEVFKTAGIKPVYQWSDMDSLQDDAAKAAAGQAAIAKVRAEKPDLIITVNDDCLKFVGTQISDIPVVFAWVFGSPESLGLPKANITGVVRSSYAADIWGLAHKLFGAKTVSMISKYSLSMAGVRKYLFAGADKLEAASGVRFKEMYLVNTFDEWKEKVKNCKEDFIYMADTSRILDGDKQISRSETVSWTVENSKKPVIASSEDDTKYGGLYSIVTSESAIGHNAAEVALKVLDGTKPSDIPYVSSKKGKLVVNLKTAQKYGLEIPYDILSTAEQVFE